MVPAEPRTSFWQTVLIFNGLWALYYLFSLIRGEMPGGYYKLINLLPFLFFTLSACAFYLAAAGGTRRLSGRMFLLLPLFLILLDQALKALVRQSFPPGQGTEIPLLLDWIAFKPSLNTRGSWMAHLFNLKWPFFIYTLLNILIFPPLIIGYRFYVHKKGRSGWLDLFLLLFIAGCVCSLADKLLFGGSLDYLLLQHMFIADLKDFYLTFSAALLITAMAAAGDLRHPGERSRQTEWQLLRELWEFTFPRKPQGQDQPGAKK